MQGLAGESPNTKEQNLLKEGAKKPNTTAKKKKKQGKNSLCFASWHHSRFIVVKARCCHDNLGSTRAYQVFANWFVGGNNLKAKGKTKQPGFYHL